MKKSELRQIIREEYQRTLSEGITEKQVANAQRLVNDIKHDLKPVVDYLNSISMGDEHSMYSVSDSKKNLRKIMVDLPRRVDALKKIIGGAV